MRNFESTLIIFLIEYEKGPEKLAEAIKDAPKELLNFRPNLEGAWTISEHVRHVVDNEFNFILRAKMSIAEPGASVMMLDEEAWARVVYQIDEDLNEYLKLFQVLRTLFARFVREMDVNLLEKAWINHPKRGRTSFLDLLKIYVEHVDFHLEFIERNKSIWLSSK